MSNTTFTFYRVATATEQCSVCKYVSNIDHAISYVEYRSAVHTIWLQFMVGQQSGICRTDHTYGLHFYLGIQSARVLILV